MKENKYTKALLSVSKELDETNKFSESIQVLTNQIVVKNSSVATKKIFTLLQIVTKSNDKYLLQLTIDFNDLLLKYYGYQQILNLYNLNENQDKLIDSTEVELSLSELLEELHNLVGLEKVKQKVNDLIAFQKIQDLRKKKNLINPHHTLHIAFIGNPGTGKTTVARIIGKMYKQLGLLTKGHFIEVSRTDLIAGYQGQTALKVKKVIENAKGGVLFIDEAYSITENEHSDSFGRECLTELTKALEDYRNDMVVIVAGYKKPMEIFFNSNPGLKSRFNTFIEFDNYNTQQLKEILLNLISQSDYRVKQSDSDKFEQLFEQMINNSNTSSNGRFIRNLLDDLITEHARRVFKITNPSLEDLKNITIIDVKNVFDKINDK